MSNRKFIKQTYPLGNSYYIDFQKIYDAFESGIISLSKNINFRGEASKAKTILSEK